MRKPPQSIGADACDAARTQDAADLGDTAADGIREVLDQRVRAYRVEAGVGERKRRDRRPR